MREPQPNSDSQQAHPSLGSARICPAVPRPPPPRVCDEGPRPATPQDCISWHLALLEGACLHVPVAGTLQCGGADWQAGHPSSPTIQVPVASLTHRIVEGEGCSLEWKFCHLGLTRSASTWWLHPSMSRPPRHRKISLAAAQSLFSEGPLMRSRWSLTQVQTKLMSFALGPGKLTWEIVKRQRQLEAGRVQWLQHFPSGQGPWG